MTSATLFREGYDLDELISQLEDEHQGRVRVVDVAYGREGGLMGFFARRTVGVRYAVDDEATHPGTQTHDDPLEDLLRAAEAAEIVESGRARHRAEDASPEGNVEFARMLLEMAAEKAAQRHAAQDAEQDEPVEAAAWVPAPIPAPIAPTPPAPVIRHAAAPAPIAPPAPLPSVFTAPVVTAPVAAPVTAPVAAPVTAPVATTVPSRRAGGAHRAPEPDPRYALRRQLTELGVPLSWIPEQGDPYRVLDDLVSLLPVAAPLRLEPGQVLAIVGTAADAEQVARWVCSALRLDPAAVHHVGQAWAASQLAAKLRYERTAPAIVIVETDEAFDGAYPAHDISAEIVSALAPDLVWLAVDARQKPGDVRARAAGIGTVSAIALSGAARTSSPASVWDLDLPVALIDGRWASRGMWLALLLDKLAVLAD